MKTVFNCTQVPTDTLETYRAADDIVVHLDIISHLDTSVHLSINDAKELRNTLNELIREAEDNYVSVQ